MTARRIVVVDVETSGLDVSRHAVVEATGVCFLALMDIGDRKRVPA